MMTQARDLGRFLQLPTPRERAVRGLPDRGAEEKQHADRDGARRPGTTANTSRTPLRYARRWRL